MGKFDFDIILQNLDSNLETLKDLIQRFEHRLPVEVTGFIIFDREWLDSFMNYYLKRGKVRRDRTVSTSENQLVSMSINECKNPIKEKPFLRAMNLKTVFSL